MIRSSSAVAVAAVAVAAVAVAAVVVIVCVRVWSGGLAYWGDGRRT
jgi:hypothetical protein